MNFTELVNFSLFFFLPELETAITRHASCAVLTRIDAFKYFNVHLRIIIYDEYIKHSSNCPINSIRGEYRKNSAKYSWNCYLLLFLNQLEISWHRLNLYYAFECLDIIEIYEILLLNYAKCNLIEPESISNGIEQS